MERFLKPLSVAAVCATVVLVAGCGGDKGPTKPALQNNRLILAFYNTPALANPWVYQVWAFKVSWQSGPMFRLDANQNLLDMQGQPILDNKMTFANLDLTTCDSLRITLKPDASGSGPVEGLVVFVAPVGTISIPRLESVLQGKVSDSAMYFVYATPSDADTSHDNELSGVWLTNADLASPGLGSLPTLPSGWVFEGWAKHGTVLLSTGKFTGNTGPDAAKRYYVGDGPSFPGEDFLTGAPAGITFPFQFDEGDTVMISLEPEDDFDVEQPFIRWYAHHVPLQSSALWPRQRYSLNPFPANKWPVVNASIVTQ